MTGRHEKVTERTHRWRLPLLIALSVLVVLAGAVALWYSGWLQAIPAAFRGGQMPVSDGGEMPDTTDATDAPEETPAPEAPPARAPEFARPDELRGVWLTAGVDYGTAGHTDEAACKLQIDAAFSALSDWTWNTVVVPLTEQQITAEGGFDAPAYILEKARAQKLYVYGVLDCGVTAENGRDPLQPADRQQVTELAQRAAQRYAADGFLIAGFAYRYGALPAASEQESAAGTEAIRAMVTDTAAQLRAVNPDSYVGLLAEAVWAHASVQEGGSDTSNIYEELTDGGADTRALVTDGTVDFVMVKNARSTGDYSAGFGKVLSWWSGVCETSGRPLYIVHAASKVGGHERGWAADDQLARQVLACQESTAWKGSSFDSFAALTAHAASTTAAKAAFDGTLLEEYITRTLTLTSPSKRTSVTNESAFSLRGSADPNFPLTLNGEPVELTDHGYFALDVTLQLGDNVFTFVNKGVETTYTITYKILILKSVSPSDNLTLDGGAAITVSAVARRDATVFAIVGGTRVELAVTAVQDEENTVDESDYATFSGQYTLPDGVMGQTRSLGAVSVTGTLNGQSDTRTGGAITVKALPVVEDKKVETVKLPELTPLDPSHGGATLATGTVMIVTADYAETFNGDTTDDYSRPTNSYLPNGTTDILAGTAYDAASDRHYYRLGCGRRVYTEDAATYITGGSLAANTLITNPATVTADGTAITFGADWRVPFNLQLLPQAYGNPAQQNYTSEGMTTEYIEIVFSYTTAVSGTPDMAGSPLFSRAEWTPGADNTYVLRLYLTKTAQFYGYHVQWDNEGRVTFTFRHPTFVGGNGEEQPLHGFKVVLDPGHGGNSIGTAGGKLAEKTINLTYGLLLRDKLESLGATVVMTRTTDTALSLLERTQLTRTSGADLFISIHMNGSTTASVHGCTVHYFSDYSRALSQMVYEQMQAVYVSYGSERRGGFPWSPFYVCRVSEMPAMLLECGYMTNADDLEKLVTPAFQDALMDAVARGVLEYARSLPQM